MSYSTAGRTDDGALLFLHTSSSSSIFSLYMDLYEYVLYVRTYVGPETTLRFRSPGSMFGGGAAGNPIDVFDCEVCEYVS